MRLWTYLLVLGSVLALPVGATAGVFGAPDAAITTHAAPVGPAPPSMAHPSTTPGFAEVPATTPAIASPQATVPTAAATVPTAATTVATTTPTTAATTSTTAPPALAAAAVTEQAVSWRLAHARPGGLDVFASPGAPTPTLQLGDHTEWGAPRVMPVLEQRGEWLEVLVPVRPNNAVGWISAVTVDVTELADEIRVSLANRSLELHHGTGIEMTAPVAIGAPTSPTPPGIYYVTDIMPAGGAYGPWVLALNGHSDTYMQFAGGDARIGIHGTNQPGSIGQAASHGCVRLTNDVVTALAQRVALGTPVIIA